MKYFFKLIVCLCCITYAAQVYGESTDVYRIQTNDGSQSKKFMNYVFFGIGAGTLVGIAAITGFRRNFHENMDIGNVWRGASYGLYAGILLGIYACYVANSSNENEGVYTNTIPTRESTRPVNQISYLMPAVSPISTAGTLDGAALVWKISLP